MSLDASKLEFPSLSSAFPRSTAADLIDSDQGYLDKAFLGTLYPILYTQPRGAILFDPSDPNSKKCVSPTSPLFTTPTDQLVASSTHQSSACVSDPHKFKPFTTSRVGFIPLTNTIHSDEYLRVAAIESKTAKDHPSYVYTTIHESYHGNTEIPKSLTIINDDFDLVDVNIDSSYKTLRIKSQFNHRPNFDNKFINNKNKSENFMEKFARDAVLANISTIDDAYKFFSTQMKRYIDMAKPKSSTLKGDQLQKAISWSGYAPNVSKGQLISLYYTLNTFFGSNVKLSEEVMNNLDNTFSLLTLGMVEWLGVDPTLLIGSHRCGCANLRCDKAYQQPLSSLLNTLEMSDCKINFHKTFSALLQYYPSCPITVFTPLRDEYSRTSTLPIGIRMARATILQTNVCDKRLLNTKISSNSGDSRPSLSYDSPKNAQISSAAFPQAISTLYQTFAANPNSVSDDEVFNVINQVLPNFMELPFFTAFYRGNRQLHIYLNEYSQFDIYNMLSIPLQPDVRPSLLHYVQHCYDIASLLVMFSVLSLSPTLLFAVLSPALQHSTGECYPTMPQLLDTIVSFVTSPCAANDTTTSRMNEIINSFDVGFVGFDYMACLEVFKLRVLPLAKTMLGYKLPKCDYEGKPYTYNESQYANAIGAIMNVTAQRTVKKTDDKKATTTTAATRSNTTPAATATKSATTTTSTSTNASTSNAAATSTVSDPKAEVDRLIQSKSRLPRKPDVTTFDQLCRIVGVEKTANILSTITAYNHKYNPNDKNNIDQFDTIDQFYSHNPQIDLFVQYFAKAAYDIQNFHSSLLNGLDVRRRLLGQIAKLGSGALHLAMAAGADKSVLAHLVKLGADPHQVDNNGWTALRWGLERILKGPRATLQYFFGSRNIKNNTLINPSLSLRPYSSNGPSISHALHQHPASATGFTMVGIDNQALGGKNENDAFDRNKIVTNLYPSIYLHCEFEKLIINALALNDAVTEYKAQFGNKQSQQNNNNNNKKKGSTPTEQPKTIFNDEDCDPEKDYDYKSIIAAAYLLPLHAAREFLTKVQTKHSFSKKTFGLIHNPATNSASLSHTKVAHVKSYYNLWPELPPAPAQTHHAHITHYGNRSLTLLDMLFGLYKQFAQTAMNKIKAEQPSLAPLERKWDEITKTIQKDEKKKAKDRTKTSNGDAERLQALIGYLKSVEPTFTRFKTNFVGAINNVQAILNNQKKTDYTVLISACKELQKHIDTFRTYIQENHLDQSNHSPVSSSHVNSILSLFNDLTQNVNELNDQNDSEITAAVAAVKDKLRQPQGNTVIPFVSQPKLPLVVEKTEYQVDEINTSIIMERFQNHLTDLSLNTASNQYESTTVDGSSISRIYLQLTTFTTMDRLATFISHYSHHTNSLQPTATNGIPSRLVSVALTNVDPNRFITAINKVFANTTPLRPNLTPQVNSHMRCALTFTHNISILTNYLVSFELTLLRYQDLFLSLTSDFADKINKVHQNKVDKMLSTHSVVETRNTQNQGKQYKECPVCFTNTITHITSCCRIPYPYSCGECASTVAGTRCSQCGVDNVQLRRINYYVPGEDINQ